MADNAHVVLCNGATLARSAGAWKNVPSDELRTGEGGNVRIAIPALATALGANVPDVFADLAEVAAFVYAADQAITRSGNLTFDYGDKWIRKFRFEIAVRCPDFWNQEQICECLIETLGFLTEDVYEFRFSKNHKPTAFERFLGFGDDNSDGIERVVLFSGGIDSLTGAVEDILGNSRKVALVSHCPVSHLGSRQDQLAVAIAGRLAASDKRPYHLKVLANKVGTFDHEHTQRSRSFLFSSIAAVVAQVFGINSIEFYENGVVSVNLPLCEQEKNARGSRTTHPQALHRIGELLSHIANRPFAVSNHYLSFTKQDVVERLVALGHADLLIHSISCTHTRGLTQEKPHCGLCPQCLSRRFATAGAGADAHDPDSMYRTDVFLGDRPETTQRTLAERFVGTARQIERMGDALAFQRLFASEIARVTPYVPGPSREVVARLFDLHHRHATQVGRVVEGKMKQHVAAYRQETLSRTSTLWFAFAVANTSQREDGQQTPCDAEIMAQLKLLNEMERCILQALYEKDITDPDTDEMPGQKTIAEWAGFTFDTNLKNALTALVKAQLLDNGKHHGRRGGYFLLERGIRIAKILSTTND